MKTAKKLLAAALIVMIVVCALAVSAYAEPTAGQLLRYVPTTITVTDDEIEMDGYIVNLNTEYTITELTDMSMSVWQAGELLFSGDIGDVEDFEVAPLSASYLGITFGSNFDLQPGVYDCNDDIYATFAVSFSKVTSESSSFSFNFSTRAASQG